MVNNHPTDGTCRVMASEMVLPGVEKSLHSPQIRLTISLRA